MPSCDLMTVINYEMYAFMRLNDYNKLRNVCLPSCDLMTIINYEMYAFMRLNDYNKLRNVCLHAT